MIRKTATAMIALAAAALLGLLVYESRPLPRDMHLNHHSLQGELQRTAEDTRALASELQFFRDQLQIPGDGARTVAGRLAATPERLQQLLGDDARELPVVAQAFASMERALARSAAEADTLLRQQTRFAEDVHGLRDEGPRLVQQLRDSGETAVAADTFALVAATLEFVRRQAAAAGADDIRRMTALLRRDLGLVGQLPQGMDLLLDRVVSAISLRDEIDARLLALPTQPVVDAVQRFGEHENALYQQTLVDADQARMLLSVYAIVLLLGAGAIALRLHQSYREINAVNSRLEEANTHLEQRVAQRTAELSTAYEELKESQVQLVQAEKMSSLGQLVAGISHEINTPLLYLTNNAALIKERLESVAGFVKLCTAAFAQRRSETEGAEAFRERFTRALRDARGALVRDEIEDGVMDAQSLLDDSIEGLEELSNMAQSLKDFSRLDRAPVDSFNVNQGLQRTMLIARNALKHKVAVQTQFAELPSIKCSPSQINQVFLNLITNAAQAIDDNGEIVISTSVLDGGSRVAVRIADTGCGIPAENLARIRDPFFTTKEVGSGTGLGLAIVDEIVRAHHGELQIESQVGQGSVFTVLLPTQGVSRDEPAATTPDIAATDDAAAPGPPLSATG